MQWLCGLERVVPPHSICFLITQMMICIHWFGRFFPFWLCKPLGGGGGALWGSPHHLKSVDLEKRAVCSDIRGISRHVSAQPRTFISFFPICGLICQLGTQNPFPTPSLIVLLCAFLDCRDESYFPSLPCSKGFRCQLARLVWGLENRNEMGRDYLSVSLAISSSKSSHGGTGHLCSSISQISHHPHECWKAVMMAAWWCPGPTFQIPGS